MGFYPEKPIRVDYYPKTKENIDGLEIPEDILDGSIDCKITYEEEDMEEDIIGCEDCIVENMWITKEIASRLTDDIEGLTDNMEEMTEDIEKSAEDIEESAEDMEKLTDDIDGLTVCKIGRASCRERV